MNGDDKSRRLVAEERKYAICTVEDARAIARSWLDSFEFNGHLTFGLPEVDDRYHVWRVPLVYTSSGSRIGECVIDAYRGVVIEQESTRKQMLSERLGFSAHQSSSEPGGYIDPSLAIAPTSGYYLARGDAEDILQHVTPSTVDLIFTSPPYYNARPEYHEYAEYPDYLAKMRRVIRACHRVLREGRFFVINISPVLVRRASRSHASRRIAVPFDFHRLFTEEGFDFIDDIIWVKPEGAGWATGRGRRFAADRNPLQYKPVPVTEYVLVYRKSTDRLIDWNIRFHPDPDAVRRSRIENGYEVTNIWRIKPTHSREHPAVFPVELAKKVVAYYSFEKDLILDPFAGIGTVGRAAIQLSRRFFLIEKKKAYADVISRECLHWLGKELKDMHFVNCNPPNRSDVLF